MEDRDTIEPIGIPSNSGSNNNNNNNVNSANISYVDSNGNPLSYAKTDETITSSSQLDTERKFRNQFNALFRKSATYQWRQYKTNLCQIIIPVLLILLLFVLQIVVDNFIKDQQGYRYPPDFSPQPSVPALYKYNETSLKETSSCFKSMGTYNESMFYLDSTSSKLGSNISQSIQSSIMSKEESLNLIFGQSFIGRYGTYCQDTPSTIDPFSVEKLDMNLETLNDLTFNQWKEYSLLGGYNFKVVDKDTFEVSLLYNRTLTFYKDLPTLLHLVSKAYVSLTGTNITKIIYDGLRDFPHDEKLVSFDLITILGPTLYVFIFQLPLPVILRLILYEKENKLREIMKMMGLQMKTYWLVTYIFSYILYFCSIMLVWALAALFRFKFFTLNSGLAIFLLIFFWGHLLVCFAFFLSVFFSRSDSGTVLGYIWVFGTGILSSNVIKSFFDSKFTPSSSIFVISMIPSFVLYRALSVLKNEVAFDGPGIQIDTMNIDRIQVGSILAFMIVEAVIFLVLALYLEEVLPSDYGVKRHPLFFLQKSFWKGKDESKIEKVQVKPVLEGEGPDVQAERTRILNLPNLMALEVLDLNKVYPAQAGAPEKLAVKSLALAVDQGICFGFLGPNGAGKSTTISCVSGLFQPTKGTARVFGMDIRTDFDKISMVLGVCPQDNILWEDLTGEEHLLFYGRLKNLKGKELETAVKEGLKAVNLHNESSKRAGEYSGGMKRRLSVANSFMGNPKLVCLDEPSTGLDVASRKQLWDIINFYKRKCAILLTTHAMEEAEHLSDRLGIFVSGALRCIGTTSELKSRYGNGYKIMISIEQGHEEPAHQFMMKLLPKATVLNSLAGITNYEVPKEGVELSSIFNALESNREAIRLKDWGISNSTLEEVFLKVTSDNFKDPHQA
ncbi:hypothetical protein CYY_008063 [Polysphondylium violaceum]|uniref:ABC transporter domain-containing protein n=1 Tax=Polysphondylium violaceum TaxID=133409 RepID=A0A8J4PQZ2_9MYCE|nr:hypothetical protein CYY_008063 [Polysphondylium violaceum]